MKTQLIADPRSQAQFPKIWKQPSVKAQIGDYIRVPFAPVMQVVERSVLESTQVWLLLKPTTGSYTEEWLLEPEAEQQPPAPQPEPQPKPSGFSGDSVGCQLSSLEKAPQQPAPTPETEPEPTIDVAQFEQGRQHGKHDASQGWHPIYSEPITDYALVVCQD